MLDEKKNGNLLIHLFNQFSILSFVFGLNFQVKMSGNKAKFCLENRKFKKRKNNALEVMKDL